MKATWFGLFLASILVVLRLVATMPQYPDAPQAAGIDWAPLVSALTPIVLSAVKKLGFLRSENKDDFLSMTSDEFVVFADSNGDGILTLTELLDTMKESGILLPANTVELYAPYKDTVLSKDDVAVLLRALRKKTKL